MIATDLDSVRAGYEGQDSANLFVLFEPTRDQLIYDTGAAFGRNVGEVPVSGQAEAGSVIEARFVHADGTHAHTDWETVATAKNDGTWEGHVNGPRSPEWVRVEARIASTPDDVLTTKNTFGLGHVVGIMGQSEIFQAFNGGSNLATPEKHFQQVQVVRHEGTNPGGEIADLITPERGFIENLSSSGFLASGAELWQQSTDDKVVFVMLAVSGTSRWYLADDTDSEPTFRRQWSDHLKMLDAAGWQDGVRPGAIVDMWNVADARGWGFGFEEIAWRFYTGLNPDGSSYDLGESFEVADMQGGGSTPMRFDHILFDLSGNERGLYDSGSTKIIVSDHRHEPSGGIMKNWLARSDIDQVDFYMWGQREVRHTWRDLLETSEFESIAISGPDPLNYENGSERNSEPGVWTDFLHPNQDGKDGLAKFATHLVHSAMTGLGLAPSQPEFDQIEHTEGTGGYISLGSSAGPITTTRAVRSEDPLENGPIHWTDVAGFTFNGLPVKRAELTDDGRVIVYSPTGHYDSSRDRFDFGEGGGAGSYNNQQDPLNGWWKNYPIVEGIQYGLPGLEGVSIRPLPNLLSSTYQRSALQMDSVWFQDTDPVGVDEQVLSARFEWRGSISSSNEKAIVIAVGSRLELSVTPSRELSVSLRGSEVGRVTTEVGEILPDIRYDIILLVDFESGWLKVFIDPDDATSVDYNSPGAALTLSTGTLSKFVDSDKVSVFGSENSDPASGEFESFAFWKNDLLRSSDPYKAIVAEEGIDSLDSDAWRKPGGSITELDSNSEDDGVSDDADSTARTEAVDDHFLIAAGKTLVGNLLSDNGEGVDIRDDSTFIAIVNGEEFDDYSRIQLESGAWLSISSDGEFIYEQNLSSVENIAGDKLIDSFDYSLSYRDEYADSHTATVSIEIDLGNAIAGTTLSDAVRRTKGNDVLLGLSGDDFLRGGFGDDILFGGSGSDFLDGRNGDDVYVGGLGADNFVLIAKYESDNDVTRIRDLNFEEGDTLRFLSFEDGKFLNLRELSHSAVVFKNGSSSIIRSRDDLRDLQKSGIAQFVERDGNLELHFQDRLQNFYISIDDFIL